MELLYTLLPIGLLMIAYLLLFMGVGETALAVERADAHGSSELTAIAPRTPQAEKLTPMCASTLGPDDEALLAELAHEVAELSGSAVSPSAVFRALLRLVRDFDGALLVRLVGLMEREGNADEQGE
jgi:hypothetical protein